MKLILKEYLASLKERDELDAILPDLLSQMGLVVFSTPRRGIKEYGVDIAAVGSIGGGKEKVYLLSVKAGNLTRETWNGSSNQVLRPSLDEILDSYIPARVPPEHKDKPIEICLCFGGGKYIQVFVKKLQVIPVVIVRIIFNFPSGMATKLLSLYFNTSSMKS